MKIETARQTAWSDPVVTVTLTKRDLAALYQVAGSRRACLCLGSSLLTQLVSLAKDHGVEGYDPKPALEGLVSGLER